MEKYIFCCQQLENNCTCEVICCDAALLVQLISEVVTTFSGLLLIFLSLCEMISNNFYVASVEKSHLNSKTMTMKIVKV